MKQNFRRLCLACVWTVALLLASCGKEQSPEKTESLRSQDERPSILLITMDTTRADHLGCYGYEKAKTPNLDALGKEGVIFTRAYCQTPMTLPSHASILTGLYPMHHGIRLNGPYRLSKSVPTIADVLQKEGWATGAFVSAVVLDSQYGLDKGFDVYEDNIARDKPGRAERRAEETVGHALKWLQQIPGGKPWFAWVHLFDPHAPYQPPEPYKTEFADSPYDGEIAYMDEMIGRLVTAARAAVSKDNLMIIATADHGEGLGEHGEKTHSLFAYDSTIRVPMIVSPSKTHMPESPKENVGESNELVESVDICDTVLTEVGIRQEFSNDGECLKTGAPSFASRDPARRDTMKRMAYAETYYPLSFGWSPIHSVRQGPWKLLLDPRPELYRIGDAFEAPEGAEQAQESINHIEEESEIAGQLRAEIEKLLDSMSAWETGTPLAADTNQLRDLGYLGSSLRQAPLEEFLKLSDPADHIADFDAINAARAATKTGQAQAAMALLEPIVARDPNNPALFQVLGSACVALNRIDDAVTAFSKYHALAPEDLESATFLGHALLLQGKAAEAEAVLRSCTDRLPSYADAWDQLGVALGIQHKFPEAVDAGRRAHELEPSDMEFHLHYAVSLLGAGSFPEAEKHLAGLAARFPERRDIVKDLKLAQKGQRQMDESGGK